MRARHQVVGFTLNEMLVVIGLIGLLVAVLLPAVVSARRSAANARCLNNVRQVAMGLIAYAGENAGRFPPNVGARSLYWYNASLTGRHLGGARALADGTLGGGPLVCPADDPASVRSYSMNLWASSMVSDFVLASTLEAPPRGRLFALHAKPGERLILVAEAFTEPADEAEGNAVTAPAVVGFAGRRPGDRFGAGDGAPGFVMGTGVVACQLTYARHRTGREARLPASVPRGSINLGFADGHAASFRAEDLADFETGRSRLAALWSPVDGAAEGP